MKLPPFNRIQLLSRRVFFHPDGIFASWNPINIPHRGSKQELHYTFIGFDITRTQLYLSPYREIICPQNYFQSLLRRSFIIFWQAFSDRYFKKKKKRFSINKKKMIPLFDLDDFSIYFSRLLRNFYCCLLKSY